MTQKRRPGRDALSPTDVVRTRLKELRTGRGWSARELAEQCAAAGAPQIDRDVIANIETGRRAAVSVDELMVLAHVLDVAPVHLLTPSGDQWCAVTPSTTLHATLTRAWIRGETPAPGQDRQRFLASLPPDEFEVVMTPGQYVGFMAAGSTVEQVAPGVFQITPKSED